MHVLALYTPSVLRKNGWLVMKIIARSEVYFKIVFS